jgi:hypothetical protein
MLVGSFLFFCIILAMIFRGSLKFGAEGSLVSGFLFFIFIFAVTKDIEIATGAGAALSTYTL